MAEVVELMCGLVEDGSGVIDLNARVKGQPGVADDEFVTVGQIKELSVVFDESTRVFNFLGINDSSTPIASAPELSVSTLDNYLLEVGANA